jgi:Restriction endonuclease
LHGQRARKGVFITTSTFSQEARAYVAHIDPRIVLIDGRELASLMIDHGVGVTSVRHYELSAWTPTSSPRNESAGRRDVALSSVALHFAGEFVTANGHELGMPQRPIARPLNERDLNDNLRPHPSQRLHVLGGDSLAQWPLLLLGRFAGTSAVQGT